MKPTRAASWFLIIALVPVGCAVAAVVFAFLGIAARADANAYNAAPTCASDGPLTGPQCRRVAPAVVESTRVVRSGKSVTTSVSLWVYDSWMQDTTLSGDQSGGFPMDTPVTITLWGSSVAQVADSTRTWSTQDSPIYNASRDVTAVIATLASSLALTRILGWAGFSGRVVPRRFALADVAVVLSVVMVGVLSAVHAATAAACATVVAALLLAASVTVWPRLAWVRRPGP